MPLTPSKAKKRHSSAEASSQKKRSKTAGSPSKSNSISSETLRKVTIQIQNPDNEVDPILVSFPGGVPPHDPPPQFQWSQLNSRTVAGRSVEGRDKDGCVYKASSQGLGYDDRRTKVCVGVYDKQTGVLTVHQAASRGTVYSLQQHLPTYKEELQPEITGINTSSNLALFADFGSAKKRKVLKSQQDNLVNVATVIGTEKAMVDVMLGDDNDNEDGEDGKGNKPGRMSESNRKAVEEARKSGDGKAISPEQQAADRLRKMLLPPFNRDTNTACQIYEFRHIAGEKGWDIICRTIHATLKSDDSFYEALTRGKADPEGFIKPPEERGWPPSVLDCVRRVSETKATEATGEDDNVAKQSSSATHQLRCVLLFHHLVKFYTKFHKGSKFKEGRTLPGLEEDQPRWYGIPRTIAQAFFKSFCTEDQSPKKAQLLPDDSGRRRPVDPNVPKFVMSPLQKEKCMAHVLLVYLLARGGSKMMVDDLSLITKDLGSDSADVEKKLKTVGVALTKSSSKGKMKTKATLPAPLKFPKTAMKRGASGKR